MILPNNIFFLDQSKAGGTRLLWNVGKTLHSSQCQYPRRVKSSSCGMMVECNWQQLKLYRVFVHARVHACLCTYVHMHACLRMYVCMYACMYSCMYVCMYVCVYACMHVCMYVCMYVCVCVCVCTYICMYVWLTYVLVNIITNLKAY